MGALLLAAACQKPGPPPPPPPPDTVLPPGNAPNTVIQWVEGGRRLTGVPEVIDPVPPTEVWAPLADADRAPKRLEAFSQAEPSGCTAPNAIPSPEQFAKLLGALASEPAAVGVFEVVALANGCSRLVEWRAGGEVRRWELRRFWKDAWVTGVRWDFDPGVKRPSTVDRYGLQSAMHRFGEWAKGEVHQKTFRQLDSKQPPLQLTHYAGEDALYATGDGAANQRISSNHTTRSCRLDGSNHCDDLEGQAYRWFESPY